MMNATNGHDDHVHQGKVGNNEMLSMEMESLHPGTTTVRRSKDEPKVLAQIWMFIKLLIETYPKVFSTIGLFGLGFFMYKAVKLSQPPMQRHKIQHHDEYSNIPLDYDFKAAQIDHWCLFGGDSACKCEDVTEPLPREEIPGWLAKHETNKASIKLDYDYDVVFLGDDIIEAANGTWYGRLRPEGAAIKEDWKSAFGENSGMEGLALGIAGDSASNLMWRLTHGEMPKELFSKVFWISIGSNDLSRGGCSEEATVLGILRVAEEVAFHNTMSIVVIQGILPRSPNNDGSLVPSKKQVKPLFGKKHPESYYADLARNRYLLWPSIKAVNKELEDFCEKHDKIVYFDASQLFLGTTSNDRFTSTNGKIIAELMDDYVHPSRQGHQVLNDAMKKQLEDIIFDEDETNDIVEPGGGRRPNFLRV